MCQLPLLDVGDFEGFDDGLGLKMSLFRTLRIEINIYENQ